MNKAFEKWLQELTYDFGIQSYVTHEVYLNNYNVNVNDIRNRVKDDFLMYRYYIKDSMLIKECFYMQFNSVSCAGLIRYESRISDSNKSSMKIDECDFPKLMGPITKLHKYVYRFDEDDDAVIRFFFYELEQRRQKLLDEIKDINKTLDYLLDYTPSALRGEACD